jgi:excinuclease ABC subunit B
MAIQIRTSLDEPETAADFVPHRPARPEKSEGGQRFEIVSDYSPAGDQPTAIAELHRPMAASATRCCSA